MNEINDLHMFIAIPTNKIYWKSNILMEPKEKVSIVFFCFNHSVVFSKLDRTLTYNIAVELFMRVVFGPTPIKSYFFGKVLFHSIPYHHFYSQSLISFFCSKNISNFAFLNTTELKHFAEHTNKKTTSNRHLISKNIDFPRFNFHLIISVKNATKCLFKNFRVAQKLLHFSLVKNVKIKTLARCRRNARAVWTLITKLLFFLNLSIDSIFCKFLLFVLTSVTCGT